MKRVTVLLFNDFTNDNRVMKECRSLVRNGYEVNLIATGFDSDLPEEEVIEGINIKRLTVGRIKLLPYNLLLFWWKIIRDYNKEALFHANDLYALPPAYVIKKFFKRKACIVYDCHEYETEAQIYVGKPLLKFFAKVFERLMIGTVDRVIVVSESIRKAYQEMYDIKKPYLVMNCPYYKEYKDLNLFRDELDIPKDKVIFLYQGLYKQGRGIEDLVDIFQSIQKKNSKIVLVLLTYGEGIEVLKNRIKDIDNVYWHDKAPLDIYMNYVASADWGILLLENVCKSYDFALPNKLFDYIMGKLPVIVSNVKEMKELVEKENIGYVVNPSNKKELEKILLNTNIESKKKYIKELNRVSRKYCWEAQEKELLSIYKSLY